MPVFRGYIFHKPSTRCNWIFW